MFQEDQSNDIKSLISKFWDLETIGINNCEPSISNKYKSDVKLKGERYEVSLPFKENHPTLPDNYASSKKRLSLLIRRLQQKPDVLQQYDNVIQDQLKRGLIEKVENE